MPRPPPVWVSCLLSCLLSHCLSRLYCLPLPIQTAIFLTASSPNTYTATTPLPYLAYFCSPPLSLSSSSRIIDCDEETPYIYQSGIKGTGLPSTAVDCLPSGSLREPRRLDTFSCAVVGWPYPPYDTSFAHPSTEATHCRVSTTIDCL